MSSLIGAQSVYNQLGWGTNAIMMNNRSTKLNDGSYFLISGSAVGVDGDKSTSNLGMSDNWISKIKPTNEISWQKSFGGSSTEGDCNILVLNNGNLVIVSSSDSPISGNKSVNTKGQNDFWVLFTDSTGNPIWQKSFGSNANELISSIISITDSTFCLIGRTNCQIVNGDVTDSSNGSYDYWIVLIDDNGEKIWDKTFGGLSFESPKAGIYDSVNQRILIIGSSSSGASGDKSESSYGSDDIWLISLDLNGNLLEQKSIGGSNLEGVDDIIISQGNILIAATSDSDISGTKTQNSFGNFDAWLVKLNSNLDIIGDYAFGGNDIDNLNSIIVKENGQLVLACSSASGVSGNKSIPLKGVSDCWFIGLNEATLEIEWETVIGGSLIDSPLIFWETPDSYKVVSISGSPISIDKTVSSWGETDFWVYEFSKTVALEELSNDMLIYPNPSQDFITVKSENSDFSAYTITDINGRISKQGNSTANAPISLMELVEGVYFITLKQENGTEITHRFVKG